MRPVSSRTILACRDTLAAGLLTRYAGMAAVEPGAAESAVDRRGLPPGISAREWTSLPQMAQPLEPEHIPALHAEARQMAWRDGAWDMTLSLLPPLIGIELGLVSANTDWSACPDYLEDALLHAAMEGRLARWHWRPMAGGPPLRLRRQLPCDATLRGDGSRAGEPPAERPQRATDWRRFAWSGLERFGIATDAPAPAVGPRATGTQRAYIVDLRKRLGREGEKLPAALTRREASTIISDLLGDGA